MVLCHKRAHSIHLLRKSAQDKPFASLMIPPTAKKSISLVTAAYRTTPSLGDCINSVPLLPYGPSQHTEPLQVLQFYGFKHKEAHSSKENNLAFLHQRLQIGSEKDLFCLETAKGCQKM
ncbi:hypothetical protein L484_008844 [Morus notabilis]|uniref:Uncharacterized protein n=1 Tax=Morus notabilis TaxID=981085 RepID=W9QV86_9ROSA|nr:hypothetical protein L484_008844 [Morus notabilis]